MKKNQREHWENAIGNMNPDNQLELATILVGALGPNEHALDREDKYDNQTSQKMRLFLEKYIKTAKTKSDAKKGAEILERFFNLSIDSQRVVINKISSEISLALEKDALNNRALQCKQVGHTFGEWKKRTWTTQEVVWDAGPRGHVEVPHAEWSRTCLNNCGYIETTEIEPEEVQNARLQNEKNEEIKRLKKELKRLENND